MSRCTDINECVRKLDAGVGLPSIADDLREFIENADFYDYADSDTDRARDDRTRATNAGIIKTQKAIHGAAASSQQQFERLEDEEEELAQFLEQSEIRNALLEAEENPQAYPWMEPEDFLWRTSEAGKAFAEESGRGDKRRNLIANTLHGDSTDWSAVNINEPTAESNAPQDIPASEHNNDVGVAAGGSIVRWPRHSGPTGLRAYFQPAPGRTNINSENSVQQSTGGNHEGMGTTAIGGESGNSTREGKTFSKSEWVARVKGSSPRDRIVHDIIDVRTAARYDYIVQKIRQLKQCTGFIIFVLHDAPDFRHFHVVHNCNYTNGCRCSILRNLPLKRRSKTNAKLLCDVSDDYLWNLIEYFTAEGRLIIKILFGNEEWGVLIEDPGNVFKRYIIFYILV